MRRGRDKCILWFSTQSNCTRPGLPCIRDRQESRLLCSDVVFDLGCPEGQNFSPFGPGLGLESLVLGLHDVIVFS